MLDKQKILKTMLTIIKPRIHITLMKSNNNIPIELIDSYNNYGLSA